MPASRRGRADGVQTFPRRIGGFAENNCKKGVATVRRVSCEKASFWLILMSWWCSVSIIYHGMSVEKGKGHDESWQAVLQLSGLGVIMAGSIITGAITGQSILELMTPTMY